MIWRLPENPAINDDLCDLIERYRANYLGFFLDRFKSHHGPGHRGGYFNINSVSGLPYDHNCCYSWTDGRSLGELAVSYLHNLADPSDLRLYAEHLQEALLERYELNGYFPHAVDDRTNAATDDPMNVKLGPGASSFSHVFVLNGLLQYALVFGEDGAWELGLHLLEELDNALHKDMFLEGSQPRPKGQKAQGPFMISLGAIADILETMAHVAGPDAADFGREAEPFITLGRYCLDQILLNHHRAQDHAFWEVSQDGAPARDESGRIVTDPGHTIEFTGFAARFAAFLEPKEREETLTTARGIFLWAARNGFHPSRDLIYKSIDRDTGQPIKNERISDVSEVVSPAVLEEHFKGTSGAVEIASFPWWAPMELIAAGSILRHNDESGQVDHFILRAIKGIFEYYPNARIRGLSYQNIGDGFFEYVDVPPATPTLDLMHSHRSMRVFLREVGCGR